MKAQHLLFYDNKCGLCNLAVQFVLERDPKGLFVFAPLQGKTATQYLSPPLPLVIQPDSLILIENYQMDHRQTFLFGKGALRICWILGGKWKLLGAFSWLPAVCYNWIYRIIARHRSRFFAQRTCFVFITNQTERFLD